MDNGYIAKKIYSKNTINDINKKVKLLGVSSKMDAYTFLNVRLFVTIIVFLITLYISKFGYIFAPLFSFSFYKLFTYYMLDNKIKLRQINLESEAMQFFEILTLSLETGRNLQEAIVVTVDNSSGFLCLEFKELLREIKFGKSLTEAMEAMEEHIPSDTIKNIILSLTQADLYGSSIIDSLHNQIDYLREKRKMEIKGEISKVPIKISIISVFFFIPLVLIIILGPVILQYLR